jgi:DNA-binding response OmpR family regulator
MAKKKILIVDYDKKSIDSLSKLFEANKIEVVTAADGVEAYEKFKADEPDLVLLEAMLPRMHGFDLAQKITQDTKGRVPVIIVTAVYKGHQYRNEALRTLC